MQCWTVLLAGTPYDSNPDMNANQHNITPVTLLTCLDFITWTGGDTESNVSMSGDISGWYEYDSLYLI